MNDPGKGSKRRPESQPGSYGEFYERIFGEPKPKTHEAMIEQIAEDAFAAHIKDEKRNELANEALIEIRDEKGIFE